MKRHYHYFKRVSADAGWLPIDRRKWLEQCRAVRTSPAVRPIFEGVGFCKRLARRAA